MSLVRLGGVGSGIVQNITGRIGSGRVKTFSNLVGRVRSSQELIKSHGSGRVGSGRVGSGQQVMKNSRVGSDHDTRETSHSRVGPP